MQFLYKTSKVQKSSFIKTNTIDNRMAEDKTDSIYNVIQDDSTKIIKKLEMVGPTQYQLFSNIYTEQLHHLEKIFKVCIMAEKELIDKLGIDESIMSNGTTISNSITAIFLNQIENYNNYLKWYSRVRIESMKTYEEYSIIMVDAYSKALKNFSAKL